jgi:xanthosine utilization system XapX-like protein
MTRFLKWPGRITQTQDPGSRDMRKPIMRHVFFFAFVLSVTIGINSKSVAQPAPAAPAGKLPDILGITTGMTPQQAYDLLKAHDPAHMVALQQTTIPQLYGDKPITHAMNPMNTGTEDRLQVALTMPPKPQVVWLIHRQIGPFQATTPNVLNSMYQKYGMPWNPNPNSPPIPGNMQWFFDEQGNPLTITTPAAVLAMKNCQAGPMSPWLGDNQPAPLDYSGSGALAKGGPRATVMPMPPVFDPSKNPQCNNMIYVRATINGGAVRDSDLQFYLDITISDVTLQHRTFMTLNEALNNIVEKGAQQEHDKAQQQTVPTL